MAGGPITVTDRISVRVSAKTQEQSAANKKAVGGTIGKTLGNEDISDELKTQLGNTKNPVVYDEDGNAWISMEDIIAAGKTMNSNGAFANSEIHDGLTGANGNVYNLSNVVVLSELAAGDLSNHPDSYFHDKSGKPMIHTNRPVYCWRENGVFYLFDKESFRIYNDWSGGFEMGVSADTLSIDGVSYSYFNSTNGFDLYIADSAVPSVPSSTVGDVWKQALEVGYLFGPVHKTGGSLIDWNAPNAEIERQIKELHDTWDVSEHEGAVTANGTYILAGPIEFNPGD